MIVYPKPIDVRDIVKAVVAKHGMAADRAWDQTVADLWLMIAPADNTKDMQGSAGFMVQCLMIDAQRKLYERLTVEQKIELQRWKNELM